MAHTVALNSRYFLWERQLHEAGINVIGGNVRGRFGQHSLDIPIQRQATVKVLPRDPHSFTDQADEVLHHKGIVALRDDEFTMTTVIDIGQHVYPAAAV